MKDQIRDYLMKHRASSGGAKFTDEDSLIETGVIDSVTMVDLVVFLEKTYQIKIVEDDMTPENFDSVSAIAGYVAAKR